jgi:hypothetical protein
MTYCDTWTGGIPSFGLVGVGMPSHCDPTLLDSKLGDGSGTGTGTGGTLGLPNRPLQM